MDTVRVSLRKHTHSETYQHLKIILWAFGKECDVGVKGVGNLNPGSSGTSETA